MNLDALTLTTNQDAIRKNIQSNKLWIVGICILCFVVSLGFLSEGIWYWWVFIAALPVGLWQIVVSIRAGNKLLGKPQKIVTFSETGMFFHQDETMMVWEDFKKVNLDDGVLSFWLKNKRKSRIVIKYGLVGRSEMMEAAKFVKLYAPEEITGEMKNRWLDK